MKKRLDFCEKKETGMDEKLHNTLNAEFEIPKVVNQAKQEAFAKIREQAAEQKQEASGKRPVRRRSRLKVIYNAVVGTAAAAAGFSLICIANPAFAADIPVVGSVFERIGKSIGFSGDYSEYAKPLLDDSKQNGKQEEDGNTETPVKDGKDAAAEKTASGDTQYSKTVDGVTVTLSEAYCNEQALYLSMLVKSEKPIPETQIRQDGTPVILTDADLNLVFNPGYKLMNAYLDGKMLDNYTYAGVLRVDMSEVTTNYDGINKFYEARNAFLKEKGYDMETIDFSKTNFDEIAQALGMDSFADENFAAIGGPDITEYNTPIEVPKTFTADFDIHKIVGQLPQEQDTTPEMPQEFQDAYDQAMADAGLEINNYENFTEEEKETERKLHNEMWNKYVERYPEVNETYSSYSNWLLKGDWDFTFDVEMNDTKNVTKEVNLLDENGNGVISVMKTPFELSVQLKDPNAEYFAPLLDADGDLMPYGGSGSAGTYAVQDRDVSKVYVYLCDYMEYMDELKGYYWSPDYAEKKKTKNFKQYLDEKGIPFAEVTFADGE